MMFNTDEYMQVINCYENAIAVREEIKANRACAIPLSLGDDYTRFHISFVDLSLAIPIETFYNDGSAGGLQINVDRYGSYAVPWGKSLNHPPSFGGKIGLGEGDMKYLADFFNTVLTGKNYFK